MGKNKKGYTVKTYIKEINKENKKGKKKDMDFDTKVGCGAVIALIIIVIAIAFISPLFLMWGWNLGVLALFPALPTMGYWTAFWACIFLGAVGNKFKSTINFQDYFNKD